MNEKEKIENWIKCFEDRMDHFCKTINFKESWLDCEAIQFMNSGFGIKGLKELLNKKTISEDEK